MAQKRVSESENKCEASSLTTKIDNVIIRHPILLSSVHSEWKKT